MRNQKAAELDIREYLPKIIQSKHKAKRATLVTLQEQIFELCDRYDGALEGMAPPAKEHWEDDEHSALESCYIGTTNALSTHKDSILSALKAQSEVNLQRCAYCMLNDPRTWDHYLPKESFPEYSVYHANLLYICFGCNHRKSRYFHHEHLLYCHPYFSVDANTALLHCDVSIEGGVLAIQYYCSGTGELEKAGEVAQRHLKNLRLHQRFAAESSSRVSGLISELRQVFPQGVSAALLRDFLHRHYAVAQQHLGINAWDSRLWHGLAHCESFCDYANEKIQSVTVPSSSGFDIPAPRPRAA